MALRDSTMRYLKVPEGLVFEGVTDSTGRLFLHFHQKELLLGANYELGLESYSIDTSTMYNVFENQYRIIFIKADGTTVSKDLGLNKIATCMDLLLAIGKLEMGFDSDFSFNHAHVLDLKKGKLLLPVELARSLGIANSEYKVSSLMIPLNPHFSFYEENVTIKGKAVAYIGMKSDLVDKLTFPFSSVKNVWNIVSSNSFQSIYVYSDLVETEIISGYRLPFVGVFPFHETASVNMWRDIEPIWRRVARERISECYIQLADSRGHYFDNVRMTVHCKIRRRNLT